MARMDGHPICRPVNGTEAAAISFQRYAPPPEIRNFVESIWTFEASRSGQELKDHILPDVGSEIICRMDVRSGVFIRGAKLLLEEIAIEGPACYMGARLRPGIGPQLFKVAAKDMFGSRLALADLGFSTIIHPGKSGRQTFTRALLDLFRQRNLADGTKIALRAADVISGNHGRISADAVASALGCSTRHLHREMLAVIGMGPKTVARIARIRRAITLLRLSDQPLAQVAYEAGYSDQAHMTREFSVLKAPSPARLRQWRESDFVNTSEAVRH